MSGCVHWFAGIESADVMEQDVYQEAGNAEWQNDVQGLVAVYDTAVSAPSHTSILFSTEYQVQICCICSPAKV